MHTDFFCRRVSMWVYLPTYVSLDLSVYLFYLSIYAVGIVCTISKQILHTTAMSVGPGPNLLATLSLCFLNMPGTFFKIVEK